MQNHRIEGTGARCFRARRTWPGLALAGCALVGAGSLVTSELALSGRANAATVHRALSGTGAASNARVTVSATGTASGIPNELTLSIGALTNAPTAAAALARNDSEVAALDAVLIKAGVQRKNLQTSGLSLQANTDSSGNVTGYQASDTVVATTFELASAGTAIDAAARAVGNDLQINGISFSISNSTRLLDLARERAMAMAREEATTLAEAAGTSLGPVVSINDQDQLPTPIVEPVSFNAVARAAASVPVQAGSQQVSVQLNVVYQLKEGHS